MSFPRKRHAAWLESNSDIVWIPALEIVASEAKLSEAYNLLSFRGSRDDFFTNRKKERLLCP